MIRKNSVGDLPVIDPSSYVDPSAEIIGKVKIGKNVYIGPGAIIRADEMESSIVIQDNCNVQDRVIIHALAGSTVEAGKNNSLAHGCIVHGPCIIGAGCFIGFGSVVFNAKLGDEVIIKHLVVVEGIEILSGKVVPSGTVIDSDDKLKNLAMATEELRAFSQKVVKVNLDLVEGYKNT
ncbi:MAG: carbonate dehydratase [Candidatus Margulisiibacteriota bacterium]